MGEFSIFGRREQQPPDTPPVPVAVTFGTPEERRAWDRQLFIKYLVKTHRLGRGDMEADR